MEASISPCRSPLSSRRSRVRSVEVPLANPNRQNIFKLLEEPNERQRKSYSGESRLLNPSPLSIVPVMPAALPADLQGIVHVRLVSESGGDEDDTMLGGVKSVPLSADRRAEFALKMIKKSRKKFRLKFTINVVSGGINYAETVFSLPFAVITTKKSAIRTPEITNMHLRYGLSDRENEVWIKGCNFSARNTMQVMFGDKPANILETDDNIIICLAPMMLVEPGREKQVEVRVANVDTKNGLRYEADRSLIFTYCAPAVIPLKEEMMPDLIHGNLEANSFFSQYV